MEGRGAFTCLRNKAVMRTGAFISWISTSAHQRRQLKRLPAISPVRESNREKRWKQLAKNTAAVIVAPKLALLFLNRGVNWSRRVTSFLWNSLLAPWNPKREFVQTTTM